MRTALVALVVTAVIGVFPASAAAGRFSFRGGPGAFGDVPVTFTMTGRSLRRPRFVTSFTIGRNPVSECPGYSGPARRRLPVRRGNGGPRGIRIKARDNGQLDFEWHYSGPGPYEAIQGTQLGPRKWIGKYWVSWLPGMPPGTDSRCSSSWEYPWEAKLVARD
jgi:hypothetical protein